MWAGSRVGGGNQSNGYGSRVVQRPAAFAAEEGGKRDS